ncbi:membrane protein [Siphonobacter aquaeclarae]|uniref:Membrane protein n=1 Tax=Siphonobacter aquaeclarae TaxID=563176 RepID=A0A1G9TD98_9BACT|nr:membrane protein [Siphonobacter aquaeclarae]
MFSSTLIPESIENHPYIQKIRNWLHSIHFSKRGFTLYHLLEVLIGNVLKFDIDQRATAVAYSFTLALFPAIIFLFTLIPYIPVEHLDTQIMTFLSEVMPRGIYKEAESTIRDIVSRKRGGVLSFGFILTIYSAMSGMLALMRAFNVAQRTDDNRGFVRTRLIALLLTVLLSLVLIVAVAVLIVGRLVVDELTYQGILSMDSTYRYIEWISYLTVFVVLFVAVSIIYYFAPALHKRWRFFNPGSVTASLLIILITHGFSYYLSNFASYNRLYGAVGTLIALMVWLYLVALLLILGFEVNQSMDDATKKASKKN